jgi:hypothetical protein
LKKVEVASLMITRGLLIIITLSSLSCMQAGVQGTSLISSFQGLKSIEVLSPTSVRLSWDLDSDYSSYKVYSAGSVTALKTETFSNTVIGSLTPATSYTFRVTGVTSSSAEEEVGGTQVVTTMSSFAGLTSGGVTLKSPTEVNLTWSLNGSNVNYKMFTKKSSSTWNLTTAAGTAKGLNQYTVSDLTPGETYCFYIQANYEDQTIEPVATAEAEINALAHCQQMTSQLENLPSVSVNSVAPGVFPWFWTTGGAATYTTEVYELDTNVRVASRVGNGSFRAFAATAEGNKQYYSKVIDQSKIAQVEVGISGSAPKTTVKVRTLNSAGSKGPIVPDLMNGGYGKQNIGKQVVSGDFNCDGLMDLAVSLPSAVITPSTSHYTEAGGVIVYYGYRSAGPCYDSLGDPMVCPAELKTDIAPATSNSYPNPVLISYPPAKDLTQVGTVLAVGNFNGDCYKRQAPELGGSCNSLFYTYRDSASDTKKTIKSCDDLAIGNSDGSFYVAYGAASQGLVTGSGGSSAGENEFTCDPTSNSCRVVRMTVPSGYNNTSGFAKALVAGDFNNDGYDELAVAAEKNVTVPAVALVSDILVYRGSSTGLYPYGTTGSHAVISYNDSGITSAGAAPLLTSDSFGKALGVLYDSRKCVNGNPGGVVYRTTEPPPRKGYDLTKCDDLVIGSPGRSSNRGSIFTCKAGVQATTGDKQQIPSWTCLEHYPTELAGTSSYYGASLLGVKNLNGYPIWNIKSNPSDSASELPEIAGSLFVGAPLADVIYGGNTFGDAGAVYGYYVTPLATDYFSGGIQGVFGNIAGAHSIEAVNNVPCDRLNANKSTGGRYHCLNQKLTMSPPESSVQFGKTMGALPRNYGQSLDEEVMKMVAISAPYRSIPKSDGIGTLANAGSIYLFRADLSTFGFEGATPILAPQRSYGTELDLACVSNCTWYSGGLSPYGPSIFYPLSVTADGNFGLGGIAGGSFNNDEEGDLVASAPGNAVPAPATGAAYIFNSNSGFNPSENTPAKTISPNLGLEGSYHFEQGKVIGDINGDGYADVVTHIDANGAWKLVVYYGNQQGLIKTPSPSITASGNQPLLISLSNDPSFGKAFFPAGDINGDGYDDVLVIGSLGSYLYYGSSSGLVASQVPAISPIGKGPLKFASIGGGPTTIDFSSLLGPNPVAAQSTTYDGSQNAVVSGDFNGDGYDDLAIPIYSATFSIGSASTGSLYVGANQYGRVVIVYGSIQGPQVNRLTGRITATSAGVPVDIAVVDPCATVTPFACKVQVVGLPHNSDSNGFGVALASVRKKNGPTQPQFDRLLISEIDANSVGVASATPDVTYWYDGAVYVYEGSLTGIKGEILQTLVPRVASVAEVFQRFGSQIVSAGDINGDQYDDIVISTGGMNSSTSVVYVFYGQTIGGKIAYYGGSDLTSKDYFFPTMVNNIQIENLAQPRPQIIRPSGLAATDLFGWGLTAVGDFNNDGFADVAINTPNADSTLSGVIPETGHTTIFFGSASGIQINAVAVSPYPKCYGGVSPVCEPYQIFLPDAVESENTHINQNSAGDINGDGLIDLLVGGVGRDLHTSDGKSATSTGVLYILY